MLSIINKIQSMPQGADGGFPEDPTNVRKSGPVFCRSHTDGGQRGPEAGPIIATGGVRRRWYLGDLEGRVGFSWVEAGGRGNISADGTARTVMDRKR